MAGTRGRPKLDKAQLKTKAVLVKMTPHERKLIGQRALEARRPVAAYLRDRGLFG